MNEHAPKPWQEAISSSEDWVEVLDASGMLVAEVWVADWHHRDKVGQANLCLILEAPQLLAIVRRLIDWGKWQCPSEIDERCTGCWWRDSPKRDCPLMEAEALLEKITRKGEPTMAERKTEFVWEDSVVSNQYILWCDEEHEVRIRSLGGVARIAKWHVQPCYTIEFDPRYVMREVMDEVEAIITEG